LRKSQEHSTYYHDLILPTDDEAVAEELLTVLKKGCDLQAAWIDSLDDLDPDLDDEQWSAHAVTSDPDELGRAAASHQITIVPADVLCFKTGMIDKGELEDGEVELHQELVPEGFPVDDYEDGAGVAFKITALENGQEVGYAELYDAPDHVRLRYLEVEEDHRRRGVASAILDAMVSEHGPNWIDNGLSSDGAALMEAYR